MQSQVIEKNVLIDTLINLEVLDEDGDPTGVFPVRDLVLLAGTIDQYKVFWEHVQDDVELPYITVSHLMGGRQQGTSVSQNYSDTWWRIVYHTADMTTTEAGANAIGMLADHCPDVSRYDGDVSAYSSIQEISPVFDRYQIQNVPQFMVGGIYRLRLNLRSN